MGECLREIAEQPLRGGVILFRQQAEIVARREKPLEQHAGVITPAEKNVGVGQPCRNSASRSTPLTRRTVVVRSTGTCMGSPAKLGSWGRCLRPSTAFTFVVLLLGFHVAAPEFRTAWFLESIATQILVVFLIWTLGRRGGHP
jgi:hypothetical protein